MRILQIITRSDLGGAQSVVINLANCLSKEHEVIVAAGDGDGKMWSALNNSIKCVFIQKLKRKLSPLRDMQVLLYLYQLNRKYKPDIIHLHSSKVGILGRLVLPKSKIVYTVHGFDSIRIAYRKFLPFEIVLQKRCGAIIGVSKYDRENLLNEKITNNVFTIYNGIYQYPIDIKNPFYFCDNYSAKILCIARLSPQKKCDLFLNIASLLPRYAFIWIGNQYEVDFQTPVNVFFMGNIPNAGAYNEYADLFILPSNYEGLPMVIIEAMSFGKPIVASNVGGISEIVIDDKNGYTVENVPEKFAEKISDILEDSDKYKQFSKNSYLLFNEKLTADKMVEEYMKVYRNLVANQ